MDIKKFVEALSEEELNVLCAYVRDNTPEYIKLNDFLSDKEVSMEISMRLLNVLRAFEIGFINYHPARKFVYIQDLCSSTLLNYRHCGKKSIAELEALLFKKYKYQLR